MVQYLDPDKSTTVHLDGDEYVVLFLREGTTVRIKVIDIVEPLLQNPKGLQIHTYMEKFGMPYTTTSNFINHVSKQMRLIV